MAAVNWEQIKDRARKYERLARALKSHQDLEGDVAKLTERITELQRELDGKKVALVQLETRAEVALNELDRGGAASG
jgi:chromosome segregation ATPase